MAVNSKIVVSSLFLIGLLLTGCGKVKQTGASATDSLAAQSGPQVDFGALLKRDDHIEICTREVKLDFEKTLGVDWLPVDLYRLSCECIQDASLYVMEELYPGESVLHNAMLQLALNFEVSPIILDGEVHPGNITAFYDYLAESGEQELGFNDEKFLAAVKASGAAASSRAPEEVLATVSSCAEAMRVTRERFPGVDYESDPYYPDQAMAVRRLEYDPSVDVTGIDVALSSRMPFELCKTLVGHDRYEKSRSSQTPGQICEDLLQGLMCCVKNLTEEDQLAAIRIALGALYTETHRTTAKSKDVLYYVLEHQERFGWSKNQLATISSTVADKSGSKFWRALSELIETGQLREEPDAAWN